MLVQPGWYDPGSPVPDEVQQLMFANTGQQYGDTSDYGIVDPTGRVWDNAIVADKAAFANINAGALMAQDLKVAGNAVLNTLTVSDVTVDLSVSNGRLVVKGVNDEEVFSVDSSGNAVLKGLLTVDRIKANQIEGLEILTNKLTALDSSVASISGFFASPTLGSTESAQIQNSMQLLSNRVGGTENRLDNVEALAETTASTAALLAELMNTELLSGTPSATFGSSLENLDISGDATVAGTLNVLGRTVLNDLGVTGTITTGLLTIDGAEGSIGTVVGALKLQPSGLGSIDILAGTVTIDQNGNIATAGTITASEVNAGTIYTDKINLTAQAAGATTSAVLSATAGTIIIPAGETSASVTTTMLHNNSLIFATPDEPVALGTKKTGSTTFTITLKAAEALPVKVNWWIVN